MSPITMILLSFQEKIVNNIEYLKGIRNICQGGNDDGYWLVDAELPDGLNKQSNVYELSRNATTILNIGVNSGHYLLSMLLANETSQIVCFDVCKYNFTYQCIDYLNEYFPNRIIFIKGNSLETLPNYLIENPEIRFDFVNIDGSHMANEFEHDFDCSYPVATNVIIVDDTNLSVVNDHVDEYIEEGDLVEIFLRPTFIYRQRLFIKPTKPE